ncbi:hypothetical protein BH09MYX1_BH09MYX1_09650 [soil metagenome]
MPKQACALGCADAAGVTPAHCLEFDPTGPIDSTDLVVQGVKSFTGKNLKFDSDTGHITTDDGATEIRAANADPTKEEVDTNGIGFRRVNGQIGIFQFADLTINAADGFHVNGATGSLPLGLVASGTITINGKIDLGCGRSHILSPFTSAGSNAGGPGGSDGVGPGGGKHGVTASTYSLSGGGGGGHGVAGGSGGVGRLDKFSGGDTAAGAGGALVMDTMGPLGGGGGGGNGNATGDYAQGGAGGGAIEVVAGKEIIIGSGAGTATAKNTSEGINVGGCAGGYAFGSGAGGGAGGSIFVEAPKVTGKLNAGLGANGGAGGGSVSDSEDGLISTAQALGNLGNCSFAFARSTERSRPTPAS